MGLKVGVGAAWLIGLASLLLGSGGDLARWGGLLLGILVVAHAIECVMFLPRLRAAGGSLPNHLLQTFLFGIAHLRTLPAAKGA
jgi:uncharacterized protein YhhL (DUF1145 family)